MQSHAVSVHYRAKPEPRRLPAFGRLLPDATGSNRPITATWHGALWATEEPSWLELDKLQVSIGETKFSLPKQLLGIVALRRVSAPTLGRWPIGWNLKLFEYTCLRQLLDFTLNAIDQ